MTTALITGSAVRIGSAIALSLAKLGINIALHYRNSKNDAKTLQNQILQHKVKCSLFKADLSDIDAVESLVPEVIATFPDLDILINNASIFERSLISETKTQLYDKHFDINLKAPFFLSKSFAKHSNTACIINIIDQAITKVYSPFSAYHLTKKSLADFTKMSAIEFAPKIRVNAVAPGLILPASGVDEDAFMKRSNTIPLKQTGHPDLIADAVIFLINSNFITGQIIYVDGGEHLL